MHLVPTYTWLTCQRGLLNLMNQHLHISTPIYILLVLCSPCTRRDAHATASENICPNGPCCTFSLLLSPSLPPSSSSSLSLSFLTPLHSSPTDPWKPLFGFSAEFSQPLKSFSSICWPSTPIFSYFLGKMVLNKCCIFIPEVNVLRKNRKIQCILKWNAN